MPEIIGGEKTIKQIDKIMISGIETISFQKKSVKILNSRNRYLEFNLTF